MHYAAAAAILLLLVTPLFAAPTSSSFLVTHSFSSIKSHSFSSGPLQYQTLHPTLTNHHTRPLVHTSTPLPVDPPPPSSSPSQDPDILRVRESQKKVAISLGVIAGFILFGFLACIIRSMYRYKTPPKRDRVAEILQRHNLQCELEELERNPYALRRPSLREPAPPYRPRPPSYTESVKETMTTDERKVSPHLPTGSLSPNVDHRVDLDR